VNGIYCNGTAGEFYSQTIEEYQKIASLLAEEASALGVPFQIGASDMNPTISLQKIRYAASLNPTAIQVILPDWFPANEDVQEAFLKRAIQAADGIGLVLYNPPHAKKVLTPADYIRLANRFEQLVGIKTAGGDKAWYEQMQPVMNRLSVFIPGHFLATGISRGASGSYSNVCAINPKKAQEWFEIICSCPQKGLEIEKSVLNFMRTVIDPLINEEHYSNQSCDKFMATMGGWCDMCTRMRWPYQGIPQKKCDEARERLREFAPFFCEFPSFTKIL
jgi:4-hydroxy-tetrahydrodipicolinate synthase